MTSSYRLPRAILPLFLGLFLNTPLMGDDSVDAFLDLNLEDLLSMEVTSVSKKKQRLNEAAAAIFVITNEDIKRSGVTTIADALRMAPGLQVARLDSNKWAVSSRGFNQQFANKLLVLMDGRSVYTPSYSGVYWEDQDTILEDIDRIEVIRGPGATVWGANAVNGVINIITKSASQTKGAFLVTGGGNEEKHFTHYRNGFSLSDDVDGRAYFKLHQRDDSYATVLQKQAGDFWQSLRAGFRLDSHGQASSHWTVQGDIYENDLNQTVKSLWLDPLDPANNPPDLNSPYRITNIADDIKSKGYNLLARWEKQSSDDSLLTLQTYIDHTERDEAILKQDIDTIDLEFQHQYQGFDGHDLVWGLGYRQIKDDFKNSFSVAINNPASQTNELISAFVQDEISIKDNLRLTFGSKFEDNDYTGTEVQPSARILWLPQEKHSLWSSISRAVRTPSAVEIRSKILGFIVPGFPPASVPALENSIQGSPDFEAEELTALEIGYRVQPSEKTSVDVTVYQNDYSNVLSFETTQFGSGLDPDNIPNTTIYPTLLQFDNKADVTSRGLELVFDWYLQENWRLQSTYTYITLSYDTDSDSNDTVTRITIEGSTPQNHLSIRSAYDFSDHLSFDAWLYYVDELKASALSVDQVIDDYTSLNLSVNWKPRHNIELSIVGQNLTEDRHTEFAGENFITLTEIERSLFVRFRIDF